METNKASLAFRQSVQAAFLKLHPTHMMQNPVMFTVGCGTLIMVGVTVLSALSASTFIGTFGYNLTITLLLFLTVLLGNFAEAVAEARGKAQADTLRKTRSETPARLLVDGVEQTVSSSDLKKGDLFLCEAGDVIPADGELVEGLAAIDEAAITGESAPVIREAGSDQNTVIGGTRVLSDRIVVRVSSHPGESFLDKMIALVEGANRQKTPNEIALTILLAAFTLVFLIVTVTLKPFADYLQISLSLAALIALFVCLIPTTIGGLLSAIGIAGMDRALKANIIAKSGKAVETAGDIDVLLLDKTGTITIGNRKATAFIPAPDVSLELLIEAAVLSSLADTTPEGKSVVELAKKQKPNFQLNEPEGAAFIDFSAETRMSGLDLATGSSIRKGAWDAIKNWASASDATTLNAVEQEVTKVAQKGGTP
ncbi:potassium-transporting ATPase subunit B [Nitritalea halalkaliphila LW7]|uniref:Potassium-transporting ATPase subunit B n=1 Tax=Nitritalea halalkaliphila LW7 TaxID=1189621 RepID=I5C078_9BACT|nr:potassium-transporting ATPase subunit B [Nitritalea halalkaliphila LW7]